MMPDRPNAPQPHKTLTEFARELGELLPHIEWKSLERRRDALVASAELEGVYVAVNYNPTEPPDEVWSCFVHPSTTLDECLRAGRVLFLGPQCSSCGAIGVPMVDEMTLTGPDGEVDELLGDDEHLCGRCALDRSPASE